MHHDENFKGILPLI